MHKVGALMAVPSFLAEPALRLLLFGGKGGVGKTTCATATALRLARSRPWASLLLVSTDPAHSLKDCLAGTEPPANLTVLELDAQECFATFRAQHNQKLLQIASRGTFLDDDDIAQLLGLSLPGMDELVAFLEISRWVQNGNYDGIVVDTAPTGHTLRLLAMPELMRTWLGALDALLAKHRYMKARFHGRYRHDEVDAFLEELANSVKQMKSLLRDDSRCRFVPVMLAEGLSIEETLALLEELQRSHMPVTELVVNRLYPASSCLFCADGRARQLRALAAARRRLSGYVLWAVPMLPVEARGRELLGAFWENVSALPEAAAAAPRTWIGLPRRVEAPGSLPAPQTRLLVFAGKGGVGKTTLACATALRLNQEFPDKEILVFSTDPAHSLAECLERPVGSTPTRLCPGLMALTVDAEAEFKELKQLYSQELNEFLESLLPSLDLTYDRRVMERVLDLSPPGLDEVMALTKTVELLEKGAYDLLVLDSAPTGHLIRLLELPNVIDQWLKVFFGLFLKYKRIFRLPKVSQRLVEMSRSLKRFRMLLNDADRSAVYAVSILTEMAFDETCDLLATCGRMGMAAPQLFLNLATPPGECALCTSLHHREQALRQKFSETLPGLHQTVIYRQGEPRGMEQLKRLGRALYEPAPGNPVQVLLDESSIVARSGQAYDAAAF
jgi:arsenite-transporting ATPase